MNEIERRDNCGQNAEMNLRRTDSERERERKKAIGGAGRSGPCYVLSCLSRPVRDTPEGEKLTPSFNYDKYF
jgi:hypothetical protein